MKKTLDDAEKLYRSNDLDKAKKLYLDILQQTDVKSLHAEAYWGLARIAVKQKDPETGERLFEKTLELEPEPFIKAWSLIFLARLAAAAGDREKAIQHFQDALKVQGASEDALKAAQQGVKDISK